MIITEALISMVIIAVSLMFGMLSFILVSTLSRGQKKEQMEELMSQFINLIIFMWMAKILLNLDDFIKDPLVILAYPSDSLAFYIAVLLMTGFLVYKMRKGKTNLHIFLETFITVFLTSSIMYEFICFVREDNLYSFAYLTLLIIILIIFLLFQDRMKNGALMTLTLLLWSVGIIVLAGIYPGAAVFGYTIRIWFVVLMFTAGISIIHFTKRKAAE